MNKKANNRVFLPKNSILAELEVYMVLVESSRPLLFVCRDVQDSLFIVSCHCATAAKTEWILAQTTSDKLINLLSDRITIRDCFVLDNSEAYIVTRSAGTDLFDIKKHSLESIADILPTVGYYMEAEEGEFEEELKELQEANVFDNEYLSIRNQHCVNTLFTRFPYTVSIPQFKWLADEATNCLLLYGLEQQRHYMI